MFKKVFHLGLLVWFLMIKFVATLALKTFTILVLRSDSGRAKTISNNSSSSYDSSPDDNTNYSKSSSYSSNRTIKLKFRRSLLKGKEKQIILSRPTSPDSKGSSSSSISSCCPLITATAAPKQLVVSPQEEVNSSSNRLCVPVPARQRTKSELDEVDDQVMPLPTIRTRPRKWKSCSNVQALLQESQLRRAHSKPELLWGTPLTKGGSAAERAGNSNLRKCFALSEVDEKKRRALLLMRRSGRQLSDPSGYRTPKVMFTTNGGGGGGGGHLDQTGFMRQHHRRNSSSNEDQRTAGAAAATMVKKNAVVGSSSSKSSSRNITSQNLSSPSRLSPSMKKNLQTAHSQGAGRHVSTNSKQTIGVAQVGKSKFLVEQQIMIKSAQRGP